VFTGLVEDVGRVVAFERDGNGARLTVEASVAGEVAEGDSVMVNGVCLTATHSKDGRFAADLSSETLARSALGDLSQGDPVNLELALRLSDRLGGHIVQGHVDGVGTVAEAKPDGRGLDLRVSVPAALSRYLVEKGSITVDGVSLTVTGVEDRSFTVSLIPETLERTNLTEARPGSRVNLEVDVIAKYVERLVTHGQ
jgi:riboflavin synthase